MDTSKVAEMALKVFPVIAMTSSKIIPAIADGKLSVNEIVDICTSASESLGFAPDAIGFDVTAPVRLTKSIGAVALILSKALPIMADGRVNADELLGVGRDVCGYLGLDLDTVGVELGNEVQ